MKEPSTKNRARPGPGLWRNIRPSLVLAYRASPRFFFALLGLNTATALLSTVNILLSSRLMGAVSQTFRGGESEAGLMPRILRLLAEIALTAASSQMLGGFAELVQGLYQKRASNYVQAIFVEKAASMDLASFENPAFLNQMQRASAEAVSRPGAIVQQIMQATTALVSVSSLAAGVVLWHPWLLPLVLISPLVRFGIGAQAAAEELRHRTLRMETDRRAQYLKGVLTDDGAAKELRIFGLRHFILTRLKDIWAKIYEADRRMARRRMRFRILAGVTTSLDKPLLFAYVVWQLLLHRITFGRFTFYIQALNALQTGFSAFGAALVQLQESHLFVGALFDFLALEPVAEAPRPPSAPVAVSPHPCVEFRNVSFRYPGTTRLVLEDVSFTIRPGEIVALAGHNGSGKTTIVKLLAGLYEPVSGQVLLDGVDTRRLEREQLRSYFSMTLQDFKVYQLSVSHNIGIGNVERIGDEAAIRAAAEEAGLDQVVAELENGYETILGRQFQRGHELSGGRRQLVALARALMRDSPIFVMDEPTAALDVRNEKKFFKLLLTKRGLQRRSVLLITHRMTAVRHAQRILLMEGGRLIEEGGHDELFARGGRYAELFKAQAEMHRKDWLEEEIMQWERERAPLPGKP